MTVSVSLCHLTFGLAWAMLGEICRSGTPTKSQRIRPFALAHRKPRPIREFGSGRGQDQRLRKTNTPITPRQKITAKADQLSRKSDGLDPD